MEKEQEWCPFCVLGRMTICNYGFPYIVGENKYQFKCKARDEGKRGDGINSPIIEPHCELLMRRGLI